MQSDDPQLSVAQEKSVTWEPKYPDTFLHASLAIITPDKKLGVILDLDRTFKARPDMEKHIKEVEALVNKDNQKDLKVKSIYIATLKFNRLWQLHPRYWIGPHTSFSDIRRKLFEDMMLDWQDDDHKWQIVVTPNKSHFSSGMPVIKGAVDNVEAFMMYSDFPVDSGATHAALYDVTNLSRLAWPPRKTPRHK